MDHKMFVVLLLCVCIIQGTTAALSSSSPKPVIIIPGLSGSALRNSEHNNKRVWVNIWDIVSGNYVEELATYWDITHLKVQSNKTVLPIEGLDGVSNLAGDVFGEFYREFSDLIDYIQLWSTSVQASPYDWRLVPQIGQLQAWYKKTQGIIEDLYNLYDQKVVIVAHSMGNLMTNYFLHQDPAWNLQYISEYVAVSPPWGGAGMGLQAVVSGVDEFGYGRFNITIPASLLKNYPCFPWIFPQSRAFPSPVIQYNSLSYTADQVPNFFYQMEPDSAVNQIISFITNAYPASFFTDQPNVPVHLITSTYNATQIGIKYQNGDWSVIFEDGPLIGDGTVPYSSLHANDAWTYESQLVIEDVSHSGIVSSVEFILEIADIIGAYPLPGTA